MIKSKSLKVPKGRIDVVIDSDTFCEIDDQFAIAYALRSKEKLDVKAIYAAPFSCINCDGPKDGMEKSYLEILKILKLAREEREVFKGAENFLIDEFTPAISDASRDLVSRSKNYSAEKPLYVIAIGAITNVASAILLDKDIVNRIAVVWLGGHAHHYHNTIEFNMHNDIAASRVVMSSGVPFAQLPCMGVVSAFTASALEIERFFVGKNPLSDHLGKYMIEEVNKARGCTTWTKVIWDVTAVAFLLNDDDRFMNYKTTKLRLSDYDGNYGEESDGSDISYVYYIKRDALMDDLVEKITK